MLKNYFASTLRFSPVSLTSLGDRIEILQMEGVKKTKAIKVLVYRYHGITFHTLYFPNTDSFESIVPKQAIAQEEIRLPTPKQEDSLLDAVKSAVSEYENEAFMLYLRWLRHNLFSSPYKPRKVSLIKIDSDKKMATIKIDDEVKAAIAYRIEDPQHYKVRLAGRAGVVKIDQPTLMALGPVLRGAVSDFYRKL